VTAVFADTVYWIALTNPRDKHAQDVGRFDDLLSGGRVYTTEEVLAELLTFFAGDSWLRSRAVETVRPDKEYSLADCISMQTMRKEGLTEVLTNDRHFEQEGFRALFRDS
jgi:predicted nucleic acid-binding protein